MIFNMGSNLSCSFNLIVMELTVFRRVRIIFFSVLVAIHQFSSPWQRAWAGSSVSIEVNGTATSDDDYLCWGPVPAQIQVRATGPNPLNVVLSSESVAGGGAIRFLPDRGARPTGVNLDPKPELSVSVPQTGSWVRFWLVGWRPSNGAKDIRVVARESDQVIGEISLMVRVRKDAETLSTSEKAKFLSAIAKVHEKSSGGLNSKWIKHVRAHSEAFSFGIHGTPLFAAWHRAFLLGLEREIQAVDPTVTLPYWRFDRPAPKLFTREFMGVVGPATVPGGFLVDFDLTNPLRDWQMFDGRGPMVRRSNGDGQQTAVPSANWAAIMADTEYAAFNDNLEFLYHNGVHNHIGGWLSTGSSPRDPLFYLLHANVDRAWAHWQVRHNRFSGDGNDAKSYAATGSYVPGRWRKGVYANDAMWPWNEKGGNQGTTDPGDDWPALAYPLLTSVSGTGPQLPPTPKGQIDYMDVAGKGLAHGTCYDDINFSGQNPLVDQ